MAARDVEKTKAEGLTLQLDDVRKQQSAQISELKSQYDKQIESIKDQNAIQINELKEQHSMQIEQLKQQQANQIEQLKQQYYNQIEQLKQQHKIQQEQQMALLKEQINTTSEKILKERSEQLSQQNKEQLSAILNPLKEGISQMKEAVEKSGREHSETMVRLDATIKTSIQQSKEAGERADKLAQALTGENKTQGNFGELRLKQLLEDMGLEEGLQFEEQTTMKDSAGRTIYDEEEGKRMIPDVILQFPDELDVIIDSKMSF
jgi:DNA recombination protein RmuC